MFELTKLKFDGTKVYLPRGATLHFSEGEEEKAKALFTELLQYGQDCSLAGFNIGCATTAVLFGGFLIFELWRLCKKNKNETNEDKEEA